jgi:tryptophan synthase beta subunit
MGKKEFNPWKRVYINTLTLYLKKAFEETKNDTELRKEIKALLKKYINKSP